jgi:hypothetical protein
MTIDPQTIEEDLRAAMHAGPPPVAGWSDPVTRVEDGITSRNRRRLISITASAALVAGVAVAGAVIQRTPPPPTATIVSAEPVAAPQILRRSPRPERQPCQLDGVDSLEWIVQSAPWGPSTGFALRSDNSERCTLSGKPLLSGTNVATGVSEPVATADLGPLDGSITRQFPATIDPGELARIQIRGDTACREGQKPRSYRNLVLTAGGKQLKLPASRALTGICGADVSRWFVEPPMDYAALNAAVQAPPVLHQGQDFTYTVRISNAFPSAYPLSSCPAFRLNVAPATSESWQRIVCTQTSIAAHSSIEFTLLGHIAPDAAQGRHKLTWMAVMSSGEAAIADMATDGAAVTITR